MITGILGPYGSLNMVRTDGKSVVCAQSAYQGCSVVGVEAGSGGGIVSVEED